MTNAPTEIAYVVVLILAVYLYFILTTQKH